MSDTYYQYQDVAELIVHRLKQMDGWDVGYYGETEIDGYTDYYSPFYWCGVATKGDYKFIFNHSTGKEERTYTRRISGGEIDAKTREKIKKLEQMTVARGASEDEEKTAKDAIEKLRNKATPDEQFETITEVGYLANPPRCNWHIEKDGMIIDKGTGVLKYSSLPDITKEYEQKKWQDFNNLSREEWIAKKTLYEVNRWNESETYAQERVTRQYDEQLKKYKLLENFNEWIAKINNTCGGMVGDVNDFYTYEEVTKTEYKTEIKPKETTNGSIKDGQCFILKSSFNYGRSRGYVYRIHATVYNNITRFHAYKLNGKNTKECTGNANAANYWYIGDANEQRFLNWIEKGAISWCELEEVKTPYEVKKVVKKVNKAARKTSDAETETTTETTPEKETKNAENAQNYTIEETKHTKTGAAIWLVKILKSLTRDEYIEVNNKIRTLGGYYSRFTHSFVFDCNPSELLQGVI